MTVDCPTCGRDFSTENGMKVHHAKIHNESLAGCLSQCEMCGNEFRAPRNDAGRFCSYDCYGEWQSENTARESNPNWSGRVEKECDHCGSSFEVVPSRAETARFCSEECRGDPPTFAAKSHPHWKESAKVECAGCGEYFNVTPARKDTAKFCSKECRYDNHRTDLQCECCDEAFTVKKSHADDRRYCSRGCYYKAEGMTPEHSSDEWRQGNCEYCGDLVSKPPWYPAVEKLFCDTNCHDTWQRENSPTGPAHWNWKGGSTLYEVLLRGLGPWRRERREVVSGVESCELCGDEFGERDFDVHHVIPLLAGGCNDRALLIPLCKSCHQTAEAYTWRLPEVISLIPEQEIGGNLIAPTPND